MADAKITELPAGTAMQVTDLLPSAQDVPGTPVTNKVTMMQVAAAISIILGIGNVPEVPVDYKDSVLVATTANIALSGEQTLDGVPTSTSRVLVWRQTNAAQNGIYVSAAGAWARSDDANTSAEVTPGMLVGVESGTLYANLIFNLVTTGTITLGTTDLTFAPFNLPTVLFPGTTIAGTSQTGVLLHSGRRLNFTNAAAKTFTVPPQTGGGGVAFAVNTEIDLVNIGAGVLTVAAGAGVTINSMASLLTVNQLQMVKLKKRANPNTWDLTYVGDYRVLPQNSQSAAYTTVLADMGKHLLHPAADANARTFTIDSNANVPYPIGTCITFVNQTSQVLSIAITSDTMTLAGTTTTGTRALAQNGVATALKVSATGWIISGTDLT